MGVCFDTRISQMCIIWFHFDLASSKFKTCAITTSFSIFHFFLVHLSFTSSHGYWATKVLTNVHDIYIIASCKHYGSMISMDGIGINNTTK
jgi:hypothetical protein